MSSYTSIAFLLDDVEKYTHTGAHTKIYTAETGESHTRQQSC